jgi:hypothetical protein
MDLTACASSSGANLIKDLINLDLDPYSLRLLIHYINTGDPDENLRSISGQTSISIGKLHSCRKKLIAKGIIQDSALTRDKPGSVYVLEYKSDTIVYKIGQAENVEFRLRTLLEAIPPNANVTMNLIHQFETDKMQEAERALHYRYQTKRIEKEYFSLEKEDIRFLLSIERYQKGQFLAKV